MKLMEVQEEQIVRNRRNGHFYRFIRREGRRVRIRPLELFPNGLLQQKTTDTIVEPDLEIDVVGDWNECVFIAAKSGKSKAHYEKELVKLQEERVVLEEEMRTMDPKGRGSHANKVKAVVGRIETLQRGLEDRPEGVVAQKLHTHEDKSVVAFTKGDFVLLPSARPGKLVKVERKGKRVYARVAVKGDCGTLKKLKIDIDALVPAEHRQRVTVR